ncbi:NAD(P)-dependent oxidoreductase [Domibacillus robiginosus]|uniref:NAD(P)-dependent oxidoreductase n=1 Tax=Domibacillus robiginosus TaxID=1071054 RepID=UPI00067CCDBF|nr:NAD(P)-dependent oxidoreductase [Domibacillus robiginosus]
MSKTVGFIGTGVMGKSMAGHLMQAGYPVVVYNRTKARAQELLEAGAAWKDTPAEVAKEADVIITIVGYPSDVEAVYLGENGILANAKPGSYAIDMTTSSPLLAEKLYEEGKKKEIHVLDAPVSGGDVGAKNGTLTIMVGGDSTDFEAVKPVLEAMGQNIILQGRAGAGQHTKMCNQIAIASNMMGVAEAIVYAEQAGLDPEQVLGSIGSGAAGSWSLANLAPRMIKGDFEPGFYIKHFIKDMNIAIQSAEAMGMNTPGLALAKSLYDKLSEQGHDERGTQAIYLLLKGEG